MTLEQTIAGHRVLRLLATGDRARVWLAPEGRVLKVLASGAIAAEAAALHRARGDHVVELLDASVDDEGQVLVFPRLPRGSLAEVMAGRPGLDAGEAVTALAPVAAALARMHAAGVAHGAVSARHVLFRADGAPMLIGFGAAELFEPGLPEVALERLEGVVADRSALAGLAVGLLSRVTGTRAVAAAALASRLRDAPHSELETQLGRELFELAAARPVRIEPEPVTQPGPRRAVDVSEVAEPVDPGAEQSHGLLPSAVGALLESGPGAVVRSVVRERWRRWSPRQRKLAIGVVAGAAALVVAIAAAPPPPATAPQQAAVVESPVPGEPESAYDSSAVTGDDPIAALRELLPRRTQCFRDLSVLCLDDVDEQGSAALDDDRLALDALVADAVQPAQLRADGASVVERLGDSVIVALAPDSEPASVLLLKGEAGWRIRDYLASRGD